MLGDFEERLLSNTSLKPQNVHGYKRIIGIMLEKYYNLGEIEAEHLEPHERDALEKFQEFEKSKNNTKRRGMPVFG